MKGKNTRSSGKTLGVAPLVHRQHRITTMQHKLLNYATSDATTLNISCFAICTEPPVQLTGLLWVWMRHGGLHNFI